MGFSLSTARHYLPFFFTNINDGANSIHTNDLQNQELSYFTQGNSRLNLISHLINNGNSNQNDNFRRRKKTKSNSNNLNDFQNISFSSYYYMAGRKFKNLINQTQTFLFGDQLDLAFILSQKPVSFPYEISCLNHPSNYLQCLINIRKDTLRLTKLSDSKCYDSVPILNSLNKYHPEQANSQKYTIEFVFDTDCDVRIKIHYFATENFIVDSSNLNKKVLTYVCSCSRFNPNSNISNNSFNNQNILSAKKCICINDDSNAFEYKKGANIIFKQPDHFIIPSEYHNSAWQFNLLNNYYPIVIECVPLDDRLRQKHAHITLAYLEKSQTVLSNQFTASTTIKMEELNISTQTKVVSQDQTLNAKALSVDCISKINYIYQIKAIKQKQLIEGILYSLQEIYGIEKKNSETSHLNETEFNQYVNDNSKNTKFKKKEIGNSSISNCSEETTTTSSFQLNNSKSVQNENFVQDTEQEIKGIECVICMCEIRDTLILPCRHLCLCKICAINLRVQSNNCPICRIPFIALVQIKIFKKKAFVKNRQKISKKDLKEDNLPRITIQGLNDINIIEQVDNLDNLIIQIQSNTNDDSKSNYEMIMKSENDLRSSKKSRLNDYYECITIYEAFDGATSFTLNENKKFELEPKKMKSKLIKINNQMEYVQKIEEINENQSQELSVPLYPKINSNEKEISLNSKNLLNGANLRSKSISMNASNFNKSLQNAPMSKSSFDVRLEEINLNRIGKGSSSCRAQFIANANNHSSNDLNTSNM